ncbi:MAG: hypothetical protein JJD98_01380 [Polaromonas sp.]|nr:hypothetical protein [Polaromonas sp.]
MEPAVNPVAITCAVQRQVSRRHFQKIIVGKGHEGDRHERLPPGLRIHGIGLPGSGH